MTTSGTTAGEAEIEELQAQVHACVRGFECTEAGVICCAGFHLRPPALNTVLFTFFSAPSGKALHMDTTCSALRGTSRQERLPWARAAHRRCGTCGATPTDVTQVRSEARKVAKPAGVIADAAASWPGRLPAASLAQVRDAVARLTRARVDHLADLRALALEVGNLLLSSAGAWAPPQVPESVLATAAVDLIGVEDDPFFRSGHRPRNAADRAAAEVLDAETIERLWEGWTATVARNGLDDPTFSGPGQRRPAAAAAVEDLRAAWTDAARRMIEESDEKDLMVVVIPTAAQPGPPTVRRAPGQRAALPILVPLAAATLPTGQAVAIVVPALVARWLARGGLSDFEVVGPWPGHEVGVAAAELAIKLAGGDIYRLPALFPAAVDLAREEHGR